MANRYLWLMQTHLPSIVVDCCRSIYREGLTMKYIGSKILIGEEILSFYNVNRQWYPVAKLYMPSKYTYSPVYQCLPCSHTYQLNRPNANLSKESKYGIIQSGTNLTFLL
jgi:hypothetical protein